MKRLELISYGIVAVAVVLSMLSYPHLPADVASHWNINGVADGFTPKIWAVVLMPGLLLMVAALLPLLLGQDPFSKNLSKFRSESDLLIYAIMLFLLYIHVIMLALNLGAVFDFIRALLPGFIILFFIIGQVLSKSKRNYVIGIRTPWTLSSDEVWDKTHKLGGKLFKLVAVVGLLGLIFKEYAFWILIVPLFAVALFLVAYSYFVYSRKA